MLKGVKRKAQTLLILNHPEGRAEALFIFLLVYFNFTKCSISGYFVLKEFIHDLAEE